MKKNTKILITFFCLIISKNLYSTNNDNIDEQKNIIGIHRVDLMETIHNPTKYDELISIAKKIENYETSTDNFNNIDALLNESNIIKNNNTDSNTSITSLLNTVFENNSEIPKEQRKIILNLARERECMEKIKNLINADLKTSDLKAMLINKNTQIADNYTPEEKKLLDIFKNIEEAAACCIIKKDISLLKKHWTKQIYHETVLQEIIDRLKNDYKPKPPKKYNKAIQTLLHKAKNNKLNDSDNIKKTEMTCVSNIDIINTFQEIVNKKIDNSVEILIKNSTNQVKDASSHRITLMGYFNNQIEIISEREKEKTKGRQRSPRDITTRDNKKYPSPRPAAVQKELELFPVIRGSSISSPSSKTKKSSSSAKSN